MTQFRLLDKAYGLFFNAVNSAVRTEQIDKFYPGKEARIRCLPVDNNKQINWYKNFEPLDLEAMNASISDDNTTITFHKVSGALNNGVYHCDNVLNNSQVMTSNNLLSIQVNGKRDNQNIK